VTEDSRDNGEFLALFQSKRRASVAQTVEPLVGESGRC